MTWRALRAPVTAAQRPACAAPDALIFPPARLAGLAVALFPRGRAKPPARPTDSPAPARKARIP
jgi:hypothetical protein